LVGEEGDQAPPAQLSNRRPISVLVIAYGCSVEMPSIVEKGLADRVMGGSSDAQGVGTQDMENAGQPFPVPLVHGKEQGGGALKGPRIGSLRQRRQVEGIPTSGKDQERLLPGMDMEATDEPGRDGSQDPGRERLDFVLSGDGESGPQSGSEPPKERLPKGGMKREFQLQAPQRNKPHQITAGEGHGSQGTGG
jgi:hypothetical protein